MNIDDNRYYMSGCFHEAGHALAALAVGAKDISVFMEPYPRCKGHTKFGYGPLNPDQTNPQHRKALQDLIFVSAAGTFAELIFWTRQPDELRPLERRNDYGDQDHMRGYAALLETASTKAEQFIEKGQSECDAFFVNVTNYPLLKAVADRLFDNEAIDDPNLRALAASLDSSAIGRT
ncbi:hypothetical protein [Afipia sp. GAS231]|uniref:hypothetical protein n=1 Tax=Afipia sp. GAS231 TaxID=1882747 RepID=UPI0012F9D016|nr:hypothetical protein [Afipia sp. GAS231]